MQLNPNAKETREEVSALRQQHGYQSRREHSGPHPELDTGEEQLDKVRQQMGMAPEELEKLIETAKNFPEFGFEDVHKGHRQVSAIVLRIRGQNV